jgi:FecR protein
VKLSLGFAAAILLLGSGTAFAGAPGWKISESSGRVVVLRSGVSQIAIRGGSLSPGDLVSTAGNARAVLVRGGEYLVVSPNSRIRIADPVTSGGFTQIIQDLGNTVFRITKKTTPHFAVETPYLAAVVKGTTFSVTVTEAGTAVQVTEGLVQVSTNDGGATHLVRPGDIGLVDAAMPLRLKIEGKEAQVIDSPNKPSATPAPSASIAAAATTAFAEEASSKEAAPSPDTKADVAASSAFDSVIGSAVSEGPVKLESVSGGLVSGNSTLLAVLDNVKPAPQTPLSESPPAPVADIAPPVAIDSPPPEVVIAPSPPAEAPPVDVADSSGIKPVSVTTSPPIAVDSPQPEVVIAPSPPVEAPSVTVVDTTPASPPVQVASNDLPPTSAPQPTPPVVAVPIDSPIVLTPLQPVVSNLGNGGGNSGPNDPVGNNGGGNSGPNKADGNNGDGNIYPNDADRTNGGGNRGPNNANGSGNNQNGPDD